MTEELHFKIGDKVRVKNNTLRNIKRRGQISEIKQIPYRDYVYLKFPDIKTHSGFFIHEIEKIEETNND